MADRVVSQELTEKIVQFQEVTGTEDMDAAWTQLERHNWDLVTAVQDHLAVKESASVHTQHTSPSPPPPLLPPLLPPLPLHARQLQHQERNNQEGDTGGGHPPTPPLAAAEGVPGPSTPPPPPPQRIPQPVQRVWRSWGWLGWGFYLMTLPLRFTLASISSILLFIYRIVYPYPRRLTDPLEDVVRFIREFEVEYGQHHPSFFQGSYSQALSHAKTELKFLLVYLHCADHQDTPYFCRTILSDQHLIDYVNTSMVFWGCSVTSPEGYRVSQAMRENSYPFLALVVLRDSRMTVVGRLEELLPAPTLTSRLQDLVRDNEAHLVVARAERQERELTAALRLQQDEDYQMSLRADQEKERKKQAQREEAQRKEQEEREKQEDQQREKDNIRRHKIEWVDRVPKEPEEGVDGLVQIVIKLPQGTRLERRFLKTDSLASLYYYIFCHPDSPDRFQVTTNFPRQVVPCEPSEAAPDPPTFEEFKMPPRSMLFVSDLDA